MTPATPETLREKASRVRIGWPALVAIAAGGWIWDLIRIFAGDRLPYAGDPSVGISFAAMWMVLVFWFMSAWDLWITIDPDPGSPSLGFGPQNHWIPRRLRSYLFPLSFLVGAYLGHRFWL